MKPISVDELFKLAGIVPSASGTKPWGEDIPCEVAGVYVITVDDLETVKFEDLSLEQEHARLRRRWEDDRQLWQPDQNIVYIGCTSPKVGLKKRLHQFYKHVYGDPAKHRGGQAIKLLVCAKTIHWAAVEDYEGAEHNLVEAFEERAKRLPYGNKRRARRAKRGGGKRQS